MDNREVIDWDHCTVLVCCILKCGDFSRSSTVDRALDTFHGSHERPIPAEQ